MSPELALQGAIHRRLTSGASRTAVLVEGRVYDHVPAVAEFPYVSFGPSSASNADYECADGVEVLQQIDIWSRKPGSAECKVVADAVRRDLHRLETDLGFDFGVVEIRFQNSRDMRDPDGLTTHTAADYVAFIDHDAA